MPVNITLELHKNEIINASIRSNKDYFKLAIGEFGNSPAIELECYKEHIDTLLETIIFYYDSKGLSNVLCDIIHANVNDVKSYGKKLIDSDNRISII